MGVDDQAKRVVEADGRSLDDADVDSLGGTSSVAVDASLGSSEVPAAGGVAVWAGKSAGISSVLDVSCEVDGAMGG